MSKIVTIWRKEFRDALRDKRSVLAAMSYAFFGPMLMAVAFFFLINQLTDPSDVEITIDGKQHAPQLVEHLKTQGVVQRQEPWPDTVNPIKLTIPESWDQQLKSAEPVTVILRADWSAQKQQTEIKRVERAVQSYAAKVTNYRLLLRGLDPRVVQPINLSKQDVATRGSKAALIMGSVLVFILLSVFWSGMNVAIDISAGERERNSLELLLSQPLSTESIVWGKTLAAASFAIFGGALSLILIPVIFQFVPLQEIGMSVEFSAFMIILMFVLLIPLALLATTLQLFVSFRAKNFKEAQTYISFLLIIPMAASFGVEFARLKTPILYYLPLTGQHQAFLSLIRGEAVNWFGIGVSALTTLVFAYLLALFISRMLNSEKTVFGL
ncbi:ABC transporter permease [Idiomarina seosinensis]|uniref:ABC transporter permease n=1 Tax=Idiomarina seosinensis TaxID=281739 RepID=A0A432ZCZ4_9GAMM|nr:ABC transporter permease subunit [Idiomarina seosinensis]RUO75843.1 ABC transporter permease [Idiomarina seosinensis]